MGENNQILQEMIKELQKKLPDGRPIGITFSTEEKKYYYDTVTGKIITCDDLAYQIVEKILDGKVNEIVQLSESENLIESIRNIINVIEHEKIFALSKFEKMVDFGEYEDLIQNQLEQLTLELTEKCNLRCGYCIYNEACEKNRDFGDKDMDEETALKAIDYAKTHSGKTDTLHIGYYGGEPLVNYPVMIKSMRYALETMKNRKLHFAFTTNAVLLTKDKCKELAEIPNLSVTVSLDGPEKWHDFYRRNMHGDGSFHQTLQGIKNLVDAFGYDRAKENILFSMVYAPPYSEERLEETQKFFEELKWLPSECVKFITYPDEESMDTIYKYLQKNQLLEAAKWGNTELDFSLSDYSHKHEKQPGMFTEKLMTDSYLPIRKRAIFDVVMDSIRMNGCCVPGQRKLYVTVNGEFRICERVGNIPTIGNIENGIDVDKAKKIYIDGYRNESMKKCSSCWYARICSICYCGCYTGEKFDLGKKTEMCEERKASCLRSLKAYFEALENDIHAMDHLDSITVK